VWLAVSRETTTELATELWRLNGARMERVDTFTGYGLFSLALGGDGTVYVALREGQQGDAVVLERSPLGETTPIGSFPAFQLVLRPGADGAPIAAYTVYFGTLYVVRWDGATWIDLDSAELGPRYASNVQLRIADGGVRQIPYLSYMSDLGQLKVWKYQ
jgi:hypothetical protein